MLFMGIDIGSRGSKGAIIDEDKNLFASVIMETGPDSVKTSQTVFGKMAEEKGITLADVTNTIGTGYGRVLVPFASGNVSEISAHARGANWCYPSVRTILDMGGQDVKAISVDPEGKVTQFFMNDKCAGGTGRFLEIIADVLRLRLEDIGEISLESTEKFPFNTVCTVFAKSEALALMKKGVPKRDILSGLHDAIATRVGNLLKRVNMEPDFTITGGISKNSGMVSKITEKIGVAPLLEAGKDPQIAGALGAALFARDRYLAKHGAETAAA
jgi:benzoyl-CoA reductase subunit A